MYIARNIDVVQFDLVKGQTDYYFPKNVSWANKRIDKIVVYNNNIGMPETSPINGNSLYSRMFEPYPLYIDLYDKDNKQIANKVSIWQTTNWNNNPLYVNNYISLELSKLWIPSVSKNTSILVYVFFDGAEREEYADINKSVTVTCTLPSDGKISFQDLVDNYITLQPGKVKGLIAGYVKDDGEYLIKDFPCGFITLRDKSNRRVFNHVPTFFCRNNLNLSYFEKLGFAGVARFSQRDIFRFESMDIDMLNSFITNRTQYEITYKITFLY